MNERQAADSRQPANVKTNIENRKLIELPTNERRTTNNERTTATVKRHATAEAQHGLLVIFPSVTQLHCHALTLTITYSISQLGWRSAVHFKRHVAVKAEDRRRRHFCCLSSSFVVVVVVVCRRLSSSSSSFVVVCRRLSSFVVVCRRLSSFVVVVVVVLILSQNRRDDGILENTTQPFTNAMDTMHKEPRGTLPKSSSPSPSLWLSLLCVVGGVVAS